GTPFLRIYPGFIRVVTTLSVAPGGAPRPGPTPKPAGNSEVGYSQEPVETPCQSLLCPCGGPKRTRRVCVPASVSIFNVVSSCQVMCSRVGSRMTPTAP